MRIARSIEMPDLRRRGRHVHVLMRDILEERDKIDLLLVIAAERRARLLADDGHHRLVIHLRVVKSIEQMDRARAGRGQTNADFAGELGMRARHERRHFFVPHLDEFDRSPSPDRARP